MLITSNGAAVRMPLGTRIPGEVPGRVAAGGVADPAGSGMPCPVRSARVGGVRADAARPRGGRCGSTPQLRSRRALRFDGVAGGADVRIAHRDLADLADGSVNSPANGLSGALAGPFAGDEGVRSWRPPV